MSNRIFAQWIGFTTSAYGGQKGGETVWLKRKYFRCGNCRKGSVVKTNYCPHCGAKMIEEA